MHDHELAAAAAGGDQQAFEQLVERYRRYIYAIAWRIVMDEDEALDIAQEVLLKMARRIGDWRGDGSFKAWVGAIASRTALDMARKRRDVPVDPQDWQEADPGELVASSSPPSPREAVQALERRALVAEAMASLTPQQRAILMLRLEEELKPAEIAERLGLKPAQVRSQLSRAVARLRGQLAE
ncbi:MAG: sigma-70 family RNA polymerase sigma factor [Candidatus Sumerlaeia bacterium]